MSYRSILDSRDIRNEVRKKMKGNRIRVFVGLVIMIVITGLLFQLLIVESNFAYANVHLPSITQLFLNFDTWYEGNVLANMTEIGTTQIILTGLTAFIVSVLLFLLWDYGMNWAFLEVTDGDKFSIRTVWSALFRKSIRHYITALIANIVSGIFFMLYIVGILALLCGAVITFIAMRGVDVSSVLGYTIILLYFIIAFLIFLLLSMVIGWIRYGFIFYMYPAYDNKRTGIFRSLSIGWQLMRGNKFRMFFVTLCYIIWPVLFVGLGSVVFSLGLFAQYNLPQIPLYIAFVVVSVLWLIFSIGKISLAKAILYRELTDQFARRLNEKYPGFGLKGTFEHADLYQTGAHPIFTSDTMAIEIPDLENEYDEETDFIADQDSSILENEEERVADDEEQMGPKVHYWTPPKATIQPEPNPPRTVSLNEQSKKLNYDYADPGYPLDSHTVADPMPASEVFPVVEEEKRDIEEKAPYNPYGYNTPKKTNFKESVHTADIILGADKSTSDTIEEATVHEADFDHLNAQDSDRHTDH